MKMLTRLKSGKQKFVALYLLSLTAGITVFLIAYIAGYRINFTPSLPVGLWRIQDSSGPLERNSYVIVSPDGNPGYSFALERGYLNKSAKMLKKVAAIEGDYVSYDVAEKAVTVNGSYLFLTEIHSKDSQGKPMQSASFPVCLRKQQVWLSSEYALGFDSRYFGPVSSEILKRAVPVWVFR